MTRPHTEPLDFSPRGVSNRRVRPLWLWLLAAIAWAPAVHAQTPEAPAAAADDAQGRADALIREGVDLRKEGREAEALERFRQAYALHPSPRALGQMALAAKSMRLYVEAERYLEGALAAADDPWVRSNREALELAREVVGRQLASLSVTTNVQGAELLVTGAVVAKLPLERPVRVPAGPTLIEVRAPGYTEGESEATLAAGSTTDIRIEIRIDVRPAPVAPAAAPGPAAAPASRLPWIFVAAGVGVVGVGVGTFFGIRTLSLKSDRDDACPERYAADECPVDGQVDGKNAQELDEEARTAAAVSTVAFAVGAAGLGAAALLWILEPEQKQATTGTARVVAAPTRSGGFVGARWSF